eukprot:Ihof_evm3s253 gene=Ihof_evmTU3s253
MSKFFAAGFSSDEAVSESSGSESEMENVPTARAPARNRFQDNFSDDSDDGKKRSVRSRKEARFDEMEKAVQGIKNHMKINDWSAILGDFDALQKAAVKARNVISTQGYPQFYLRILLVLDVYIKEANENKEAKKKMDKLKAKAMMAMKQKVSKHNKTLEAELTKYRTEHPNFTDEEDESAVASDDEGVAESDSEAEVPAKKTAAKSRFLKKSADSSSSEEESSASESESESEDEKPKKAKKVAREGGDESDDSLEWGSSDDSSSDEDEADDKDARVRGPAFYLKTTVAQEEDRKEAKKAPKKKKEDKKKKEEESEGESEGSDEEEFKLTEVKRKEIKLFDNGTEVTHEVAHLKLIELVAMRGRKNLDRFEQVSVLQRLLDVCEENELGPAMYCKVLFALISARFDNVSPNATHMETPQWNGCVADYKRALILMEEHNILADTTMVDDDEVYVVDETHPRLKIHGDIVSFLERVDDELTRSLQNVDPHTTEYVVRLRDEQVFMELAKMVRPYVEKNLASLSVCRVYLRIINHMYYKRNFVLQALAKASREAAGETEPCAEEIDPAAEMIKLCKYLYRQDNVDRMRTQAILAHIYHLAIHDNWYESRDLMLMSHLQESIQHADVPIQIMFNRTMVQLGFCAFRVGRIHDSHACLLEIYATNRAKELLAQGIMNQRHQEKKPEEEKLEKRRQMPFHMHINLELLECVYLTCAMLLEVPNMALAPHEYKRRVISKPFRRLMDYSNRSTFTGPPENTRDHVIAASKPLMQGDWKSCCDLLLSLKIWALLTDVTKVKEMLISKVQEEALRTYMFSYGGVYDTISLSKLATMFDLPENRMHAVLSKMMVNEELQASWDQPTSSVIMHRNAELTHLQQLALQFAEKGAQLVESNERTLDWRTGGYGYKDNQRTDKTGGQWEGRQQFGGGQRG